ncbi:MAG: hypothetical protein ACYS7Y_29005 [Planctomycetota bacterium]|jgi:hypothetical protein
MWNVTFYDDDTGYAYRVRVKRLTVGDSLQADTLSDDITRRESLNGRALLTLSQVYPFVRYATATCERALLDGAPPIGESGDPVVPDDVEWQAFELTEGEFLALPEFLALRWQYEVIQKNPHRDPTYEALKKKWLTDRLTNTSAPTTNTNDSVESSAAPVSSSD